MLAAGDNNGSTCLWNLAAVTNTAVLADPGAGGNSAVNDVAFSPSGTLLATGNCNGGSYLGNLAQVKNVAALTEPALRGECVTAVAFSPDGTMLATGDAIGRGDLWNLATRRVTAILDNGSPGHQRGVQPRRHLAGDRQSARHVPVGRRDRAARRQAGGPGAVPGRHRGGLWPGRKDAGGINKDELAKKRAEITVITFGGNARVEIPSTEGRDLQPRRLEADGGMPVGAALDLALV